MSKTVKKKVHLINASQNEGLSQSYIHVDLSFDGYGSCSWQIIWFSSSYTVFTIFSQDFQLFWTQYHWRDLRSWNAHLVHQNWHRISFTHLYVSCWMNIPYKKYFQLLLTLYWFFRIRIWKTKSLKMYIATYIEPKYCLLSFPDQFFKRFNCRIYPL
jgi:hypothetical protein